MDGSFEAALVERCAPTLAGLKPANLFLYQPSGDRQAVYDAAADWTRELAPYGVTVCILKECKCRSSFLIYAYRKAWIDRILSERMTRSFLRMWGYRTSGSDELLRQLSERLCMEQKFSHDFVLFLVYPLFDVVSFIAYEGRNYAFCGYWKAYFDPAGAQKRSDQYRKCTLIYKRMFDNGTPILRLIVAA